MDISSYNVDIKWVPVRYAVTVLGISRQRVYRLIKLGRLTSRTVEGTVLINDKSIEARLALMRSGGGTYGRSVVRI